MIKKKKKEGRVPQLFFEKNIRKKGASSISVLLHSFMFLIGTTSL